MWEGVGERTELQYIDLHSYGHQRCLSRSPGLLNRRPRGPLCWVRTFSTASCHQRVSKLLGGPRAPSAGWWLSLPLVSNSSDLQLTDFLSSPSYIIVQSPTRSPTQSLEWHVWSSSSGNNCHAVQRSLSSGASVYECIMSFYLVLFRQPNPPTRFLSITGHWNVSLPSVASLWNGMLGRVKGQYTTIVFMSLFCVAVRRDPVSPLTLPFLSHAQVFSCEISLVYRNVHRIVFLFIFIFWLFLFCWSSCNQYGLWWL